VVEPARGHFVRTDKETVSAVHFTESSFCAHGGEIDRKVGQGHLRFEDLPQRIAAQEFRTETVEMELVLFDIKGSEKGQSLNVVPMIVGNEDMGFGGKDGIPGSRSISQHAQSCPAVEYELGAVRSEQVQARRVTSKTPGGRVDGRRRATNAPEAQFEDGGSHFLRYCGQDPMKRGIKGALLYQFR
jgi:hypothetical protein